MPEIYFTDEQLLALNEAVNHIDDHERWIFEVMQNSPIGLEEAISKINSKASPIIVKKNKGE